MVRRATRILLLACALLATGCESGAVPPSGVVDLDGRPADPLGGTERLVVLLFARTDCPISNRYAPEVNRLIDRHADRDVRFVLVYPNPDTTAAQIRKHLADYEYPCAAVRDPQHALVELAEATITPEAAVFDAGRRMVYRGRIDDRYVDFGQARAAATRHDLAEAISAALSGRPVSEPRTRAIGCFITDLRREAP